MAQVDNNQTDNNKFSCSNNTHTRDGVSIIAGDITVASATSPVVSPTSVVGNTALASNTEHVSTLEPMNYAQALDHSSDTTLSKQTNKANHNLPTGKIHVGNLPIVKLPIGKPGPFQVVDDACRKAASLSLVQQREDLRCTTNDNPLEPPRRRYDCDNYDKCLNLAAALNWDSFTCRGCSGEVDESLSWRAYQAFKKDNVVRSICEFPEIHAKSNSQNKPSSQHPNLHIVSKTTIAR